MDLDAIYKEHYSDMPREEFDRKVMAKHGTVNHENLDGPSVVDATTSHELQNKAPDVKPVIKGTAGEILAMKKSGQLGNDKVVFMLPPPSNVAYVIDSNAVQALYGGSAQKAVTQARRDLLSGGAKESSLLGYPNREGVENPVTAAVTRQGDVVTDLPEIKDHSENGNVIWAAEGKPEDVMAHAQNVGKRWKEIKDDPEPREDTPSQVMDKA